MTLTIKHLIAVLQKAAEKDPDAAVQFSESAIVMFDNTNTLLGVIDTTGKMLTMRANQRGSASFSLTDSVSVVKRDDLNPIAGNLRGG